MDVVDLLSELVAIDSTNRTIAPDGAGERAMAAALDGLLVGLGFTVVQHEVTPGRPNVVGVRAGTPGAPTILLEAHLDTVPTPPGLVLTRTATVWEAEGPGRPSGRELADGSWSPGFTCTPDALTGGTDITTFGSWRTYLTTLTSPTTSTTPNL